MPAGGQFFLFFRCACRILDLELDAAADVLLGSQRSYCPSGTTVANFVLVQLEIKDLFVCGNRRVGYIVRLPVSRHFIVHGFHHAKRDFRIFRDLLEEVVPLGGAVEHIARAYQPAAAGAGNLGLGAVVGLQADAADFAQLHTPGAAGKVPHDMLGELIHCLVNYGSAVCSGLGREIAHLELIQLYVDGFGILKVEDQHLVGFFVDRQFPKLVKRSIHVAGRFVGNFKHGIGVDIDGGGVREARCIHIGFSSAHFRRIRSFLGGQRPGHIHGVPDAGIDDLILEVLAVLHVNVNIVAHFRHRRSARDAIGIVA